MNEKIYLTKDIKDHLKMIRKTNKVRFIDLEEKSKNRHSLAWYSQLESERLMTIKKEDLIDTISIILNITFKEAEKYIDDTFSLLSKNTASDELSQTEWKLETIIDFFKNQYPAANNISMQISGNTVVIKAE